MPAGIINTGSHPKLLWPGVRAIWGQVYDEHPAEYTDLFELDTSERAYEEDVQVTGFGRVCKHVKEFHHGFSRSFPLRRHHDRQGQSPRDVWRA